MKRTLEKSFVEVENENPVGQFRMLVNEKSFSIIISGIYSRKIEAIVREYSCNAVDSHKDAGHNKPFEIHLPNYNNPTFYVKDNGVGLDEEDIITVFTVAFASTKDNSNNTTGMLGIGGMSGFCYNTKSFTVTSWKNGKKFIYHCFIGDGGVPSYTKLLEEDTDEPNGVKVEMPVSSGDFYAFEEAAEKVSQWLEIKPTFVGEKVITIDPVVKTIQGDGWSVTNSIRNCNVLMGGVLYEVEDGDTALSKYHNHIYSNILIEAPMGSVDFQPSRERLQYTPKTVSFLRKIFLKITQEISKIFSTKIEECKSLWAARNTFERLNSDLPSSLSKLVDKTIVEWSGTKLYNNSGSSIFDLSGYTDEFTMRNFEGISWRNTAREFGWKKVSASGRTYLCLCDTKTGHIGKVRFRCAGTSDYVHLFIPQKDKSLEDVKTILIKELGCIEEDFILSSDLPEPPRNSTYKRSRLGKISKWKYDTRVSYSWDEVDLSNEDIEDETYYYIERKGYNYIDKTTGQERNPYQLNGSKQFLENIDKRASTIYGVAKREVENLPDNWIEFTTEVAKKLESKKDDVQKYLDELAIQDRISRYSRETESKNHLFTAIKDKLDPNHNAVIWLNNLKTLKEIKAPKEIKDFRFIQSVFDLSSAQVDIDFMDDFLKKYPLLDVYNSSTYRYSSSYNYKALDFLPYILGVDAHG